MITEQQKAVALAIVNVFESGVPKGGYATLALIPGDTGGLSYGHSQAALGAGSLYTLVEDYCGRPDAIYGNALRPYLPGLEARDRRLDNDTNLQGYLALAGCDHVMQKTQDTFFDTNYWDWALREAAQEGIRSALGTAIVYDSCIQGSWQSRANDTTARFGPVSRLGEQAWCGHYLDVREAWLTSKGEPLASTIYRTQALRSLVRDGNWDLRLPVTVRGVTIDADVLSAPPPERLTPPDASPTVPNAERRGPAVRNLQALLCLKGQSTFPDGAWGPNTERAVRDFQQANGLSADGIAGRNTWNALWHGLPPFGTGHSTPGADR